MLSPVTNDTGHRNDASYENDRFVNAFEVARFSCAAHSEEDEDKSEYLH